MTHSASQDAAVAALVRSFGIADEQSAAVQVKLRLLLPALVSFVSSCLSEVGGASPTSCVTEGDEKLHSAEGKNFHGSPASTAAEACQPKENADLNMGVPLQPAPPSSPAPQRRSPQVNQVRAEQEKRDLMLSDGEKLDMVSKIPQFACLSQTDLARLSRAFQLKQFKANRSIVRPQESATDMHIVITGQAKASVLQDSHTVGPGQLFGDVEMLYQKEMRQCLQAADEEVVTLSISQREFNELGIRKQLKAGNLKSNKKLKARRGSSWAAPEDWANRIKKHEEEVGDMGDKDRGIFMDAVRRNDAISEVLVLSDEQMSFMSTLLTMVTYEKDEIVFNQGDAGDAFYVVKEGSFVPAGVVGQPMMASQKWTCGDSFGESALLFDSPLSMTVKCSVDGILWKISKMNFRQVTDSAKSLRLKHYIALLENVPFFSDMSQHQRKEVCESLEERTYRKDQRIVRQGDVGDAFYLLSTGECSVIVDGEVTRQLKAGDFFGEQALLQDEPRPGTVRVDSEVCSALALDRVGLQLLKESSGASESQESRGKLTFKQRMTAAMQKIKVMNLLGALHKSFSVSLRGQASKVPFDRLDRIGFLGQGTFGFVTLERDKENKKLYALKAISKGHVVKEELTESVKSEVACMQLLGGSRFIVQLYGTYRDSTSVYLLLEPCFGGELFDVYNENELWGSEVHCKFYVASVALALEFMHERKIIYRDLKLENCLITSEGQLKLTDMGIAKAVIGVTYTICGTADYFAPETLRQHGHNRAVDWWALGVMTYVCLNGSTPFDAPDVMDIYKKIVKGFAKVVFPEEMPSDAKDLVLALCQKKPEDRLPMQTGGVKNLQEHVWFSGMDWKELADGKRPAPWVPNIDDEGIAAKIAAKPPQTAPVYEYEDDGSNWDACFDNV